MAFLDGIFVTVLGRSLLGMYPLMIGGIQIPLSKWATDFVAQEWAESLKEISRTAGRMGFRLGGLKMGQKTEGNWKVGKQDGLTTNWYENGQKKEEGNFKDDKQDGLATFWYENGEKKEEGNWKDDEADGLHPSWYENGQKAGKITTRTISACLPKLGNPMAKVS